KIMDVVEFLHDVLKVDHVPGKFPHVVSVHNSCHGVRELGLSSPSERHIKPFNKIIDLLNMVEGITIHEPERKDECCGFGGMFSIEEPAVSTRMGEDKIIGKEPSICVFRILDVDTGEVKYKIRGKESHCAENGKYPFSISTEYLDKNPDYPEINSCGIYILDVESGKITLSCNRGRYFKYGKGTWSYSERAYRVCQPRSAKSVRNGS
ncbi:putative oxidoreductase, partial [human gut metagenome]